MRRPTGTTGMALMGGAYSQAQKSGAEMAIPDEATGLEAFDGAGPGRYALRLINNERVTVRSVVIATGARYRRLDIQNLQEFEASSVHYWATPLEGRLCAGQEVALVGAGNSAGQAAVYLASQAAKVWLLAMETPTRFTDPGRMSPRRTRRGGWSPGAACHGQHLCR